MRVTDKSVMLLNPSYLFWIFAAVAILASVGVIFARNPVHAALFLILVFFQTAGIWVLLEAEFLAIALVLVYVGAVMVLFLFVLMMMDIDLKSLRPKLFKYSAIGLVILLLIAYQLWSALYGSYQSVDVATGVRSEVSNTHHLGVVLYSKYILALEVAGVLLLVAIIAAIALTMRTRKDVKRTDVAEQLAVQRQDRVEVIKVSAQTEVHQTSTAATQLAKESH